MIESSFKSKKYKSSEVIRILNPKQAAFYWINGVEPLDMYISRDFKTHDPLIVYIFSREGSKEAYDKWCNNRAE